MATYVTAILALWFFSNWFNFLNFGAEGESTVNSIIWALVDVLVVLVSSRYRQLSVGVMAETTRPMPAAFRSQGTANDANMRGLE